MFRQNEIEHRTIEVASYIVENNATVRQAAEEFGISKTTVHLDITKRLKEYDVELYEKVRKVLDYNTRQRAARGGEATSKKYKK